ncbi:MAG TPA: peptide-methionine (S)-S-oxide reductase MsrA [Candidatus Limnocylindria bacterium]|nr:peptide-methionine (S)-S-oxide reductase MsrA [Candidatus Limnocylindria bacterium]
MQTELATFGGGCFWCLEAVFERIEGVEKVESGYAGGTVANPTYEDVCGGATGHAEVIQVTYDPGKIEYRDLVELFFAFHDPTTMNRQGPDTGTQYRSVIFYHTPDQKRTAEQVIAEFAAAKVFDRPIVTEVAPMPEFYRAESYHQGYYRSHPNQSYCRAMIAPKVAKLRAKHQERLKAAPAGSRTESSSA